jgi:hypothetical protein
MHTHALDRKPDKSLFLKIIFVYLATGPATFKIP